MIKTDNRLYLYIIILIYILNIFIYILNIYSKRCRFGVKYIDLGFVFLSFSFEFELMDLGYVF
jgi:hypothetical protein